MNRFLLILSTIFLLVLIHNSSAEPGYKGAFYFDAPDFSLSGRIITRDSVLAANKILRMDVYNADKSEKEENYYHDGFLDSTKSFIIKGKNRKLLSANYLFYDIRGNLVREILKFSKQKKSFESVYKYDDSGRIVLAVVHRKGYMNYDSIAYDTKGQVIRYLSFFKDSYVTDTMNNVYIHSLAKNNYVPVDSAVSFDIKYYTLDFNNEVLKVQTKDYQDTLIYERTDYLNFKKKYYRNSVLKQVFLYEKGYLIYDKIQMIAYCDVKSGTLTDKDFGGNLYFDRLYIYDANNWLIMEYEIRYLVHRDITVYENNHFGYPLVVYDLKKLDKCYYSYLVDWQIRNESSKKKVEKPVCR